jgi:hypothetical protein
LGLTLAVIKRTRSLARGNGSLQWIDISVEHRRSGFGGSLTIFFKGLKLFDLFALRNKGRMLLL